MNEARELLNNPEASVEDLEIFIQRYVEAAVEFDNMNKAVEELRNLVASGIAPSASEQYIGLIGTVMISVLPLVYSLKISTNSCITPG